MSKIEAEIVEVTNFEPPRKYAERQDYLAALAKAINKLEEIDYNSLSTEATDWFNDSVRALNNRKDLPDFPDIEEPENEPTEPISEPAEEVGEAEASPAPKAKADPNKRRAKGVPPRKLEHPEIDPQKAIDNYETDAYGVVKGSKNAAAVAMLEKGCRMSDITASIGGTYYNLKARLRKQGHTIEEGANGMLKLIHKDS